MLMTTHSGCSWDYPEDIVLAYGEERGLRLMLTSAREDDAAKDVPLRQEGRSAARRQHA